MTEYQIVRIARDNPQPQLTDRAAALLADGELVVAPTETRYGLLARADDTTAVQKLYRLKGRKADAPMAVFVDSVEALESCGQMTPASRRLAAHFMPGPLTLVLTAGRDLTWPVVQEGRVGLRVSSSPVVQAILAKVQKPLTATSANLSGAPEAETVEQIAAGLGTGVALYLDGGRLVGPVSTVVHCQENDTELLREGAVSRVDIASALEGSV
jgi:L-threonylcarbamoyladenylate synthase